MKIARAGYPFSYKLVSARPTFKTATDGTPAAIMAHWDEIASYYPPYWSHMVGYAGQYSPTTAGIPGAGPWTIRYVTNNADSGAGSLRDTLLIPNSIVRMAIIDNVVDPLKRGWNIASGTALDGRGYNGTFFGAFTPANVDNIAVQYASVTQPFAYGKNVSGACIGNQNVKRSYYFRNNLWDSGDVLYTNGAYFFNSGQTWGPFYHTVDSCRLGPNPGYYAMMSPILGKYATDPTYQPGYLNNINNDARNGKCMESAFDHNAVDAGKVLESQLSHQAYGTFYNCVLQGCVSRNGKARAQFLDMVDCLVAKFGLPYNMGGSVGAGQGSNIEDDAEANYTGVTWIRYNNGEAFVGFQPNVAAANGVPAIYISDDQAPKTFALNGTAKTQGNARISDCYGPGPFDTPPITTGFEPGYSLPASVLSDYAASALLVKQLEDDPFTRAGNPCSDIQPPNWRDVHTGPTYPRLAA